MKIKVLIVLLPTLLVVNTANAAEIYKREGNKSDLYGKINSLHYFSNEKGSNGDHIYTRLGFKGETKINNQLTGYGQWEHQIQSSTDESNNKFLTRVAFAGLKFTDAGSLDYGRNYVITYDITSWTDVLPEFSSDTYSAYNFPQSCANGVITYRNRNFFGLINGLDFALQYQGNGSLSSKKKASSGYDLLKQNGNGYGASLIYNLGEGFSIGYAMVSSKYTIDQKATGSHTEVYSGGMKYDENNTYIAAQYSQTYNATRFGIFSVNCRSDIYGFTKKAQNLEVVAHHQFGFNLRPSVAYLQSKSKDIKDYGGQDLLKCIDMGITYFFSENMSTYIDYKINLVDDNSFTRAAGISTDNTFALGLTYQF